MLNLIWKIAPTESQHREPRSGTADTCYEVIRHKDHQIKYRSLVRYIEGTGDEL